MRIQAEAISRTTLQPTNRLIEGSNNKRNRVALFRLSRESHLRHMQLHSTG